MQNLPLPDDELEEKLKEWLSRGEGEGKIVLRNQNGRVIRADYSRVFCVKLHDRRTAPRAIMQVLRRVNPVFGSVVIHDRSEMIEVEVSESVVNVRGN